MRNSDVMVSAIIVAAGKGLRMNMDVNKQFVDICGKPVLARTIQVFEDCSEVDEIIIVVNEEDIVFFKHNIIDEYGFEKVSVIAAGGVTRQESVYNGLKQTGSSDGIVLIHDGARPFVSNECILESIAAASEFGACCVAVPVKDTIKKADKDSFVEQTLERDCLWAVQTPQSFRYNIVEKAHKSAAEDCFNGTDDAMLVERLGYRLKLVRGSYYNIKITTQEDLVFAQAIAESQSY